MSSRSAARKIARTVPKPHKASHKAVRKVAPPLGLLRFAPAYPAEFGLFVHMTKR